MAYIKVKGLAGIWMLVEWFASYAVDLGDPDDRVFRCGKLYRANVILECAGSLSR